MIGDENRDIRENAFQLILTVRSKNFTGLRRFKIPTLNFNATNYTEIIDWENSHYTEPPFTSTFSVQELEEIVENGLSIDTIKLLPCHTQSVERCIKLVTEASAVVCGEEKRDGFIRARILSRKEMPSYNKKSFATLSSMNKVTLLTEFHSLNVNTSWANREQAD